MYIIKKDKKGKTKKTSFVVLGRFISKLQQNKIISDEIFIRLQYLVLLKKILHLKKPITLNEKVQWLKLYDKRNIYTVLADKYEVKSFVAKKVGQEFVIPTIGIYDSFDEINFSKLPKSFILKCTHDCGSIIICKDKMFFNIEAARDTLTKKLQINHYNRYLEWAYKNIKPRIICEEFIKSKNERGIREYKFMCYNGKALYFSLEEFRESPGGLRIDYFDINWNKFPLKKPYPNLGYNAKKPKNFKQMIEIVEVLAKDIPYVRVDLNVVGEYIYFSEMTLYPGGGYSIFIPSEYDEYFGRPLKLPSSIK